MHGATLLDAQDQVLRPAILRNDGRSTHECQQLETNTDIVAISGNRVMPGFTAPKLSWIAQHESKIFRQIAKVLLPKDYLRLRITGTYATDMSDAAGTLWLNVTKRVWANDILTATGLSERQMPALFEGCEITATVVMPKLAKAWGILRNTVVVGGGGDNAAAAISMNVIKPRSAFLSLGTSGVYFVAGDHYRSNAADAVHSFCHCLPHSWHQMTVHLSAASCISWLGQVLQASPKELVHEAEHTPPSHDNLLFLPYLSGERTPHNDAYARGTFFGMSHSTQRADLTRAVLEGVAFAFADGQDAMHKANIVINDVSVVGGGARSLYWGKILASASQHPLIYRQDRAAGAALGAARLAWHQPHRPTAGFCRATDRTCD